MNEQVKRRIVEEYIHSYNSFDIDGMVMNLHSDVEFKNISHGEVNLTAYGIDEFKNLANQIIEIFSSRHQTIKNLQIKGDCVNIDTTDEGVLASDLSSGMQKGDTLCLEGHYEFLFHEDKIVSIRDIN